MANREDTGNTPAGWRTWLTVAAWIVGGMIVAIAAAFAVTALPFAFTNI